MQEQRRGVKESQAGEGWRGYQQAWKSKGMREFWQKTFRCLCHTIICFLHPVVKK